MGDLEFNRIGRQGIGVVGVVMIVPRTVHGTCARFSHIVILHWKNLTHRNFALSPKADLAMRCTMLSLLFTLKAVTIG